MTTILKFEGYSDDLVHVAVNGVIEEYNVLTQLESGRKRCATFAVYNKPKTDPLPGDINLPIFYVNCYYGINGSTWSFSIEQTEEDIFVPPLIVYVGSRRTRSPYSTELTITIADENVDRFVELI